MKKILVIDDEANLLRIYGHMLSKDGFEVETCACGREALEILDKGSRVDLIILDLGLPDMDGLRLLERLRGRTELDTTPIIINSGYAHLKSEFVSWLADAYIVKKSDPKELEETVQEILR